MYIIELSTLPPREDCGKAWKTNLYNGAHLSCYLHTVARVRRDVRCRLWQHEHVHRSQSKHLRHQRTNMRHHKYRAFRGGIDQQQVCAALYATKNIYKSTNNQ